MNKILTLLAVSAIAFSASAETAVIPWPQGAVTDITVDRSASTLIVNMNIHPDSFPKKSNREVWLRPAVVAETDTLFLDPVLISGRTRYYQHLRLDRDDNTTIMLRAGSDEVYAYQTLVPYQDWMELSDVVLLGNVDGCCGHSLDLMAVENLGSLDFRPKTLSPVMVYVTPTKEIVKTRTVSGEAYIDFLVNQTQINPDYRRNPAELAEIRRTIDAVRDDSDVTITSLSFKGYASPEGPYNVNERLARGRTEALIDYVRRLYDFPESVMHSSWVAEDWAGLEARLRKLDIDDRDAILAVVTDSTLTPDMRDAQLKKRFPRQYAYLLKNIYPSLRHSDYNVTYQIRNFTDVEEIAAIMATSPQKLSLDELFLYAKSLDKDSQEFRDVMEVAVRMYPDDPEANLNAASTAVAFGDYDKARAYLSKAGGNPVAIYLSGVIEAMQGNHAAAAPLLQSAADRGVTEAADLLNVMRDYGFIN